MSRHISQSLNMHPLEKVEPQRAVSVEDGQLEMDLDQARKDIKEIAEIGIQAVAEAASLASQSQHDKLYMALSSVMKSTIEANRELIDVHRSRQELTRDEPSQVTNQLFVGSTADLLDLIGKKEK
jgi:DNA-binding ferritin-like protein